METVSKNYFHYFLKPLPEKVPPVVSDLSHVLDFQKGCFFQLLVPLQQLKSIKQWCHAGSSSHRDNSSCFKEEKLKLYYSVRRSLNVSLSSIRKQNGIQEALYDFRPPYSNLYTVKKWQTSHKHSVLNLQYINFLCMYRWVIGSVIMMCIIG